MGELYLIGTVHVDPDGKERLEGVLQRLSPGVVAVELSKDRASIVSRSREEIEKGVAESIEKSGIPLTPSQKSVYFEVEVGINMAMGYEYRVSREFADNNPTCKLVYADLGLPKGISLDEFKTASDRLVKRELYEEIKSNSSDPKFIKSLTATLDRGVIAYKNTVRRNIEELYRDAANIGRAYEEYRRSGEWEKQKQGLSPDEAMVFDFVFNPKRDDFMAARIRKAYDGKKTLVAVVGLRHLSALEQRLRDLEPEIRTLGEAASIGRFQISVDFSKGTASDYFS